MTRHAALELEAGHRRFYSAPDPLRYGREGQAEARRELQWLLDAVLADSPMPVLVLELGAGTGALIGVHPGYVALEYSEFAVRRYLRGARAICGDMQRVPVRDASIACVVSIAALEHVPAPEVVLAEIDRVLRPEGIAYLAPAWFCRPWAAENLAGRSYRELGWRDRLVKAAIPFRDSLLWRGCSVVPRRLLEELRYRLSGRAVSFRYRRLMPNLEEYLTSDSDAFASMDPHAALLYFVSRGYAVLGHGKRVSCVRTPRSLLGRLLMRNGPVIVLKGR